MRKRIKKIVSEFLICVLVLSLLSVATLADNAAEYGNITENTEFVVTDDYSDYLSLHTEANYPAESYTVNGAYGVFDAADSAFKILEQFEGKEKALLCERNAKRVTYAFEVKNSGYYAVDVNFFPLTTEASKEEIGVMINGEFPFEQAKALYLTYSFSPETQEIRKNSSGDEYAARRVVNKDWTDCTITNPDHNYDSAILFWLNKGENTVSLILNCENEFVLGTVSLKSVTSPIDYREYLGENEISADSQFIKIEAEKISLQSDSTVVPVSDQSDPLCSPPSVMKLKNNVIGSSWSSHGQWLQWDFTVKESGWYNLSLRYKQNGLKGLNVKRKLYLDGEVPFAEVAAVSFPYSSQWKMNTISDSDGNPYCFYLEAGEHTVRMEAILGELADVVREVDDIVYEMNSAYRSVIMVTSASADKYRDYQIDRELPELVPKIKECAERLRNCNKKVEELADGSSADSAILVTTANQLKSMAEDPDTIPYRLSSWESNIGSVSSWTLSIREQPLQLDYMIFSGKGFRQERAKANIAEKAVHSLKRFFVSFIKDYSSLEDGKNGTATVLTVWIGTGRDQAETVWQMTNDMFTPETGIKVNVKLVSATMIEAFLSGQTPDVSVQVARDIPVNLAVRGALCNLSSFDGFEDVKSWFTADALTPYTMQECVYGLPDTQSFNMLFYRTDVFNELGLSVPNTWGEFINVANQLHLKQLETGIPIDTDVSIYYSMLMQKGGKVFSDDLSTTLLDTKVSIEAFTEWTDLFTQVGLPLSYNFFNRFRSGEMPMAIAPYLSYNQLISAAPEIRNLWKMTSVPGTLTDDGKINRSESASGTATVILSSTKHPEESWKFIKWWVGDAAQIQYAKDIESRVGTLGRVASANTRALESLEYSAQTMSSLLEQRSCVVEIPQIPGNYYLDRDLLNAFRDVVYNSRNPKESILDYSNRINNEIDRKRKELGLE